MSAPARRPEAATRITVFLIVVAALVRLGALWHWRGNLVDDRDDYLTVARQYVARGFWKPFDGYPSSFRPPLYPLVLAAILKAGGGSAAIGAIQLLLGTATVGLTVRIGKKLQLGRLRFVAGFLVALDPLLGVYTTFPMTETIFTFLLALLMASALPAVAGAVPITNRPLGTHARAKSAGIGLVFGLCALCRPSIWPLLPMAAAWIVWRERRRTHLLRAVLIGGAGLGLGIACVVIPWGVRNWMILGIPVVTTTHGGYTLLLGNNREFYHEVASRPLAEIWAAHEPDRFQESWFRGVVADMDRELGADAGEVAQDRWMYQRAWQSMAAEPRLFLRACLLRFASLWNVVPLAPSRATIRGPVLWGLCVGYVIELALFVIGAGGLAWRPDGRWVLALIVIINFTAVHLVYWSNMRMRAPLVPLIALFAARGLACCLNRHKVNKCVGENSTA